MSFKNLKKSLAVVIVSSIAFSSMASSVVCALNENNKLAEQQVVQQNVNVDPRLVYLAERNIPIMTYAEFIHNSGLNFNQIRDILDNDNSINFDYLYKLSTFMGNHWVSHKHNNISQGEVFKKLLNVVKALHMEYDNLSDIDGLMSANFVSLHDLYIFVNKGFTYEQKQNLSLQTLLKRIRPFASETYNDFFRSDFKKEGYSGYGVAADIIENNGWTLDQIDNYLKDGNLGLYGLKCMLDISNDGGYKLDDVINIFKNSNVKFKDVSYLYDKIVKKYGFACYDFLDVIEQFKDYEYADYVKMAENAKKSGRTYFEEVEYNYFNVKKIDQKQKNMQ